MSEKRKARVVLVIPNSTWMDRRPWRFLPHSALILTALLKDEFDFDILDANITGMSMDDCRKKLAAAKPDVVMVSGCGVEYHMQYHAVMEMGKSAGPGVITVLGGIYSTVMYEEAVKDENTDYLFIGHAEGRVCEFLHLALAGDKEKLRNLPGIGFIDDDGREVINLQETHIGDVKNLAKPDYSLLDVEAYLPQNTKDYQFNSDRKTVPMITSYGCPYNCLFCAARTINGRKVAFRSVDDVMEEIDMLVKDFGVENLIFLDECMLLKRSRVEALLNAIIDRNYDLTWKASSLSAWHLDDELLELMKKSGCTQITISVESGNQRVVKDVIHKPLNLDIVPGIVRKCREIGIDIGSNFVIGIPGETWDEIRDTFRFAELCDFDLSHFHIATPSPKSDLYELAKEKGLLPEDFSFLDPKFFGYARGYIETDEFTAFELMVLRAFEYDRINFNTREKTEKIARMMGLTMEELDQHRKQTRLKCGVHY